MWPPNYAMSRLGLQFGLVLGQDIGHELCQELGEE